MTKCLTFNNREAFRKWLGENHANSEGVWLVFGKANGPLTLSANDALEEALCFGWIDGQLKKIDETCYQKYFANRRANSPWSVKNKQIAIRLMAEQQMMPAGLAKVAEAKTNGHWQQAKKPSDISDNQIQQVFELLKSNKVAQKNFTGMSKSVQKTYTRAYLDAKTPAGKEKRLQWIIDRVAKNLKPM